MSSTDQGSTDDSRSGDEDREERLADDVDAILDEIDETLDANSEEFVRSYVQKAGQGWSFLLTPEFYVTAAVAGVLSGATYDGFKKVIARVTKALRQVPGPSNPSPVEEDQDYDRSFEYMLEHSWENAVRLTNLRGVEHSIDEATAMHWALFTIELNQSFGSIRLGKERYKRLANASAAEGHKSTPAKLAAQIIDQWLDTNQRDSKRIP